jgi:hypothetical protein
MSVYIEFVYALHWGDGNYFYVGRSKEPSVRFRAHIDTACPDGTKKERHIYEMMERGYDLNYEVLESGLPEDMTNKENLWKVNLEAEGYELLNSKEGDTCHYTPIVDRSKRKQWTPELFEDVEWGIENCPKTQRTEKSVWVNGIAFYKRGQSRLRFIHPKYGSFIVEAGSWSEKIEKACEMMTPGTAAREQMIEQYELALALKG